MASVIEKAYGLLWTYTGTDQAVHAARRILLAEIDKAGQERGITFAQLEIADRGLTRTVFDR